jgi:hypothetical protein
LANNSKPWSEIKALVVMALKSKGMAFPEIKFNFAKMTRPEHTPNDPSFISVHSNVSKDAHDFLSFLLHVTVNVRPQTHLSEIRDISVLEAAKYYLDLKQTGRAPCQFKKRKTRFGATPHEVVFYRKKMKNFQETEFARRERYDKMFKEIKEGNRGMKSENIWELIFDQEYKMGIASGRLTEADQWPPAGYSVIHGAPSPSDPTLISNERDESSMSHLNENNLNSKERRVIYDAEIEKGLNSSNIEEVNKISKGYIDMSTPASLKKENQIKRIEEIRKNNIPKGDRYDIQSEMESLRLEEKIAQIRKERYAEIEEIELKRGREDQKIRQYLSSRQ